MNAIETPAYERYQYKPFPGSSHSWALKILSDQPASSTILDIGAGSGAIGRELRTRGFEFIDAVEVDERSREHISPYYNLLAPELSQLTSRRYDIILLLDVLEHIVNPKIFFEEVTSKLNPGGQILISLPNVAHWSVRIPMLFGYFNYKDRGIMDRTHVNFYTRNSAKKLISCVAGLNIRSTCASIEPLELILPEKIYKSSAFKTCSRARIYLANILPGFFAFQNLFHVQKL